VTLAEMAFAGGLGIEVDAARIPRQGVETLDRALFSESQSRIVLTVPPAKLAQAEALLKDVPHARIGTVTTSPRLVVRGLGAVVDEPLAELKAAWQQTIAD
jgi:phosphoribosylformylglycinamidine synthase